MLALSISRFEFIVIFLLVSGVEHSAMVHLFEKESLKNFGKKWFLQSHSGKNTEVQNSK